MAELSNLVQQIKEKMEGLQNTVNKDVETIWYTFYNPYTLGSKFVVIRSWQIEELNQDYINQRKRVIKIDPGVSFGRGHPTTNLMVQAIEKYWKGGSLLDVGTGTGLLSIVAQLLVEDTNTDNIIDAFDISETIIQETRRNLKLNNVADKINLRLGQITDYKANSYDIVLANLLPEIFEKVSKELVKKVKKNGLLIISGFPTEAKGAGGAYFDFDPTLTKGDNHKAMQKLFKNSGLTLVEHLSLENNSALVFKK